MKKLDKKQVSELIIIFAITLFLGMFCFTFTNDEIWNYGFSYNIVNGLLPYKDFNMVITPLYSFMGSIFLIIFGKNISSLLIMNSIICTIIFYMLKKSSGKYVYITYIFLLGVIVPNYNLLCMLFLLILINLEKKENTKNDYLIGIVLGLTFLTKQNIGIYLCVTSLFTKSIKKILKRIVGFFIPTLMFLVYLLLTNSLGDFINYAFLGISSFAKENIYINLTIIFTIISIIFLISNYIKTKKIEYIYLLLFQLIAFPIFGSYHIITGFVPVLNEMLKKIKIVIPKIYIKLLFCLFILLTCMISTYQIKNNEKVLNTNLKSFNYRVTSNIKGIDNVTNYLNNNDNVFIIGEFAYLYKLESKVPINKYDLVNNGNLGKNGDIKIINEFDNLCKHNACKFLIDENEFDRERSQTNKKIYNYVKDNYMVNGNVANFTIYRNEVGQ